MLLSGFITYAIYKGLQYYYHTAVDYQDLLAGFRAFMLHIGDIYFFLMIFIPLAILIFYFLTKPYVTYFNEISKGIHSLAQGDFQHRVTIDTKDEFGDIAKDINLAGGKLIEAIERGDFSESSRDELVVNLAHDLRTPLTSVLGYLELILKDDSLTEEQIKHYIMISFTKSQRLEKLIDELFEITRMNYGMLTIEKNPINLSNLLNQLNEELYPVFEQNHLTSRLNVAEDLPILGDGELLARVFENLLSNAIRYGIDGQFVDIHSWLEAGEVVVQVINYGDSISEEELPYLFEMFYKGDEVRTSQENSTGLGLFIAKNLVEQHHGIISADSNVIRTVFEVRLPQHQDDKEQI